MKLFTIVGAALILGTYGSSLRAQEDAEFKERIIEIKKKKLLESLALSKDKENLFLKVYDEYFDKRRDLNRERKAVMKRIAHMSQLQADDIQGDKVTKAIEELGYVERKIVDQRQRTVEQLRGTLTEPELARFVIFEQNFPIRMREMIFDIRARKHKDKDMRMFIPPGEDDLLD